MGPGIANDIRSIISAGIDFGREGNQSVPHVDVGGNGADHNNGQFVDKSVSVGIGHIKLISAGYGLFVRGCSLEFHVAEYGFTAVKQQIKTGTAVCHVGKAVTSGAGGQVGTAGVRYADHFQATGRGVGQHHGGLLVRHKGESLLQQDVAQASGPPDGNGMETIYDPVIIRGTAKLGIDGVQSIVDGNIHREIIGGRI